MIGTFSLTDIARDLALPPPARDASFAGVSTDSRGVRAGELFVALSGERFDGHDFVADVERRGAAALLCSRDVGTGLPALRVPDCLVALGRIGAMNRARFGGALVALTGSAGKTTTKEMIAAVLRTQGAVLATEGNLNNEIGVPLTLLRLDGSERSAVVEMGAGKPGDIAYLAALARPRVALVTNVLPAHLQGMGTLDVVAETKGAIYDHLAAEGAAILNLDEPFAAGWRARIGARRIVTVSAGGNASADVRARDVVLTDGRASFVVDSPAGSIALALALPGVQQVANALMAIAVGLELGVALAQARSALEALAPVGGRMSLSRTASGCVLIDDSYNANPGSVRAAIDSLASFGGTRVLVLGNMAELGPQSAALHRDVGAHARERGIDRLLAVGENAAAVVQGFGAGGQAFATREALAQAALAFNRAGVTLLVKGSRSAGMEAVVAAVRGTPDEHAEAH